MGISGGGPQWLWLMTAVDDVRRGRLRPSAGPRVYSWKTGSRHRRRWSHPPIPIHPP